MVHNATDAVNPVLAINENKALKNNPWKIPKIDEFNKIINRIVPALKVSK